VAHPAPAKCGELAADRLRPAHDEAHTDLGSGCQPAQHRPGSRAQRLRLQHVELADLLAHQQVFRVVRCNPCEIPLEALQLHTDGEQRKLLELGGFLVVLPEQRQLADRVSTAPR
jgi:hypothetical protein